MIGVYDYTVLLTYMSLASAGVGIFFALHDAGHPYIGMFFLLFCGLCDTFDGKVARAKKNRTEFEKKFGVQIDSLSDLVAFGVLPGCIGIAMLWRYKFTIPAGWKSDLISTVAVIIVVLYMLAGLIRLAYFNVTEEIRQKTEDGCRKYYEGVPITSAALVFPFFIVIQFITKTVDLTPFYFALMLLLGAAFITKIKVKKPTKQGIWIMLGIGFAEFVLLLVFKFVNHIR